MNVRRIGDKIGVNWDLITIEEFSFGVQHEYREHRDVLGKGPRGMLRAGRTAHAHLKENPHYYSILADALGEDGPADGPSLFPGFLLALAAFGALWLLRGSP